MRHRSVQPTTASGAKKSRASYGGGSPASGKKSVARKISQEKIAERAHLIWEREGRPDGRDKEFWFRAEAELKNEKSDHLKF